MRILLDTHIFIWFVMGNPRIKPSLRAQIADEDNEKLLSIVSVYEMAIKHNMGKLNFDLPFMDFIQQQLSLNNINLLNINLNHLEVFSILPLHHRDPFDRLIIATAMVEKITYCKRRFCL